MTRIARISLTTPDADRLAEFYETAFGFRRIGSERRAGDAFESLMQIEGGAESVTLQLGNETIELLEFDSPGRPYPVDFSSSSLIFQHFAIVVQDMGEAYGQLCSVSGWSPITYPAPQQLPSSSGGVTAFKLRDPDGHPLELLEFPKAKIPEYWNRATTAMPCQGIDHSAISIADTKRSLPFYQKLGFRRTSCSTNSGQSQERLDQVAGVQVVVTALMCANAAPHLELLCYRSVPRNTAVPLKSNDVASITLVLEGNQELLGRGDACRGRIVDPDGHAFHVSPARSSNN